MKKLFMMVLVAITATSIMAQEKMKVVTSDGKTTEFVVKRVERVYFEGEDIVLKLDTAENITDSGADISFMVEGADGSVSAGLFLSTSSSVDHNDFMKNVALTVSNGKNKASVSHLRAGTTYYYRAYAKVDDVYFYSDETLSFTTLESTPRSLYREPYTNWGATIVQTRAYMIDYKFLTEAIQGSQTILTYRGKDEESLVKYVFENAKLTKANVVLERDVATIDDITKK